MASAPADDGGALLGADLGSPLRRSDEWLKGFSETPGYTGRVEDISGLPDLQGDLDVSFTPAAAAPRQDSPSPAPSPARQPARPTPSPLDIEELYQRWLSHVQATAAEGKLRVLDLFLRFDRNQSGVLSHSEFQESLEAMHFAATQREARALANYIDIDRSGFIDYPEFASGLRSIHVQSSYTPLPEPAPPAPSMAMAQQASRAAERRVQDSEDLVRQLDAEKRATERARRLSTLAKDRQLELDSTLARRDAAAAKKHQAAGRSSLALASGTLDDLGLSQVHSPRWSKPGPPSTTTSSPTISLVERQTTHAAAARQKRPKHATKLSTKGVLTGFNGTSTGPLAKARTSALAKSKRLSSASVSFADGSKKRRTRARTARPVPQLTVTAATMKTPQRQVLRDDDPRGLDSPFATDEMLTDELGNATMRVSPRSKRLIATPARGAAADSGSGGTTASGAAAPPYRTPGTAWSKPPPSKLAHAQGPEYEDGLVLAAPHPKSAGRHVSFGPTSALRQQLRSESNSRGATPTAALTPLRSGSGPTGRLAAERRDAASASPGLARSRPAQKRKKRGSGRGTSGRGPASATGTGTGTAAFFASTSAAGATRRRRPGAAAGGPIQVRSPRRSSRTPRVKLKTATGTPGRRRPANAMAASSPVSSYTAQRSRREGASAAYGADANDDAWLLDAWLTDLEALMSQNKLRVIDVFRRFDRNEDQFLTPGEICDAMHSAGHDYTLEETERLVAMMEADPGLGRVTLDDFTYFVRYRHQRSTGAAPQPVQQGRNCGHHNWQSNWQSPDLAPNNTMKSPNLRGSRRLKPDRLGATPASLGAAATLHGQPHHLDAQAAVGQPGAPLWATAPAYGGVPADPTAAENAMLRTQLTQMQQDQREQALRQELQAKEADLRRLQTQQASAALPRHLTDFEYRTKLQGAGREADLIRRTAQVDAQIAAERVHHSHQAEVAERRRIEALKLEHEERSAELTVGAEALQNKQFELRDELARLRERIAREKLAWAEQQRQERQTFDRELSHRREGAEERLEGKYVMREQGLKAELAEREAALRDQVAAQEERIAREMQALRADKEERLAADLDAQRRAAEADIVRLKADARDVVSRSDGGRLVAALHERVDAAQAQFAAEAVRRQEAEAEAVDLRVALGDHAAALAQAREAGDRAELQAEDLRNELVATQLVIDETAQESERLKAALNQRAVGGDALARHQADLEHRVTELTDQAQRVGRERDDLEALAEGQAAELAELRQAAVEGEQAQAGFKQRDQELLDELRRTLLELRDTRQELADGLEAKAQAEAQLGAADTKNRRLAQELANETASRDREISVLTTRASTLDAQLTAQRDNVVAAEDRVQAVELDAVRLRAQVAELTQARDALEADRRRARAHLAELQAELGSAQSDAQAAEARVAALQGEAAGQAAALAQARESAARRASKQQAKAAELEAALAAQTERAGRLEAASKAELEELVTLRAKVVELAGKAEAHEKATARGARSLADREAELDATRSQLTEANGRAASREADLRRAQKEAAGLRRDLEREGSSTSQTAQEALRAQTRLEAEVGRLQAQLAEARRSLQSQLDDAREEARHARLDLGQAQRALEELQGTVGSLRATLREASAKGEAASHEARSTQGLREQLAGLKADVGLLRSELEAAHKEKRALEERWKRSQEEGLATQRESDDARARLHRLTQEHSELVVEQRRWEGKATELAAAADERSTLAGRLTRARSAVDSLWAALDEVAARAHALEALEGGDGSSTAAAAASRPTAARPSPPGEVDEELRLQAGEVRALVRRLAALEQRPHPGKENIDANANTAGADEAARVLKYGHHLVLEDLLAEIASMQNERDELRRDLESKEAQLRRYRDMYESEARANEQLESRLHRSTRRFDASQSLFDGGRGERGKRLHFADSSHRLADSTNRDLLGGGGGGFGRFTQSLGVVGERREAAPLKPGRSLSQSTRDLKRATHGRKDGDDSLAARRLTSTPKRP